MNSININGIGMTSQRTRRRLVQRLEDEGIHNQDVLNIMASTPRHIFIDEAIHIELMKIPPSLSVAVRPYHNPILLLE